jgi:uncharacterized PurR-regulated membrane protein YhhQ (DUF165 family)
MTETSSRSGLQVIEACSVPRGAFRYYDFMMAAFVTILILSNLIGAAKLAALPIPDAIHDGLARLFGWNIHGFVFGAGILFFPVDYVLGDVLTEVYGYGYGYGRARRGVWAGFGAMLFMAVMSFVVVAMPPFSGWSCAASDQPIFAAVTQVHSPGAVCQATYDSVFGSTWRIVAASLTVFWAGEFANSYVKPFVISSFGDCQRNQRIMGA